MSTNTQKTLIKPSFIEAIGFQLSQRGVQYSDEPFMLRSDVESNWYFDAKLAMCSGFYLRSVGALAIMKAKEEGLDYSHICAMGIGGYAVMFSMVITDPENTCWTEAYSGRVGDPNNGLSGESVEDQDVLLVDDVFTSGSSLGETADMVRGAGGRVKNALVLASRSDGSAEEKFRQAKDVSVVPIFRFSESEGRLLPAA